MRNHSQWCEYTCKAISSGAYRHGEHMHGDLTCWEQLGTTNNEKTGLHSIDISVIYRVLTKNWVLKVNGVLTSYFDESYCLHPKLTYQVPSIKFTVIVVVALCSILQRLASLLFSWLKKVDTYNVLVWPNHFSLRNHVSSFS